VVSSAVRYLWGRKRKTMEFETFWDEELPGDNDDRVSILEATIAEDKAMLKSLDDSVDLF
jgi:hypothetical protein